ncbi:molecular chaperone [Providencia rettgeri]|uniref:fimbrial biogenesis chaperone n=1 Tax=Providencia rettgeri TaxID=587 RepID=UPI0034E0B96C
MRLMTITKYSLMSMMLFVSEITSSSAAGVGLNSTRVIFPQNSQSVPVTIRNSTEKEEYLVQVYITKTASDSAQETVFDVLPPMFYLKSAEQRDVRIAETTKSSALPKDRESVYYLHARSIPRSEKDAELGANKMKGDVKIALESIIKVFYRPTGLTQSSDQAQSGLTFSPVQGGLKVTNNSPYFVTLSSLKIGNQQIEISSEKNNTMLAPFSDMTYPTSLNKGKISWSTINDLGGYVEHSTQ